MINKIKNLFFTKNEQLPKENRVGKNNAMTSIIPKKELLFGKVLSFSFDSLSVQMAASFHYGHSFQILDVRKEYLIQESDKVKSIEDFYEECVLEFVNEHKSHFTKIFLTLTGESTLYRTLLLPELKSKDLATAVAFEVKKNIPFPIEESVYDFRVIQKIKDIENNRFKISLHAATKEIISKQLAPFKKHRIKVDRILHSHDTIGQLLGLLKDFDNKYSYTVINIGKRITEISFYKGQTLEFSRSSVLSTDMLGGKIDSVKLEYFAESIANEIQNSLDFYSGQLNASSNNNILLYGDFAYSDEFIAILNSKLETKLERFPIDNLNLHYNKDHDIESFPVCLPVLATSVNYSTLPDLLPLDLKQERKTLKINNGLKVAAAIIAITLMSSWTIINSSLENLQSNHKSLETQVDVFINSEAYHSYKMIKQEIAYDRLYIDLAKSAPSYMHLNLKELSRITPENIKLFHLNYNPSNNDDKNYFIQGIVRSDNIPPEITLAEFIENLSSSQFYEDVQIVRHVKKRDKTAFEIEFLIKMRGIV